MLFSEEFFSLKHFQYLHSELVIISEFSLFFDGTFNWGILITSLMEDELLEPGLWSYARTDYDHVRLVLE